MNTMNAVDHMFNPKATPFNTDKLNFTVSRNHLVETLKEYTHLGFTLR